MVDVILGDRFHLGDRIGAGSYSEVYVATDTTTGTPVAVKVLRRVDPEQAHAEIARLERARHPNVIGFYGSGIDSTGPFAERPWVAMELADESLADLVDLSGGSLPWDELEPIVAQILRGLAHLHADHGLVHRDLKPDNVLAVGGTWHIADLGLSSPPSEGGAAPDYTAPEVRDGGVATVQSDLWSLGALIVRCLTGAPPLADGTVSEELPPAALPLVRRLLRATPEERPESAVDALEVLEDEAGLVAAAPGIGEPPKPSWTTWRARTAIALGSVAALVIALVVVAAGGSGGDDATTGTAGKRGGESTSTFDPGVPPGPEPIATTVGGEACTNEFLGYSLTIPEGWSTLSKTSEWSNCQLFVEGTPGRITSEFGMLMNDGKEPPIAIESLDRDFDSHFGREIERERLLPLAGYPGVSTLLEEYEFGDQLVTVVRIDRGPTVLAVSLYGEHGESAASFDAKERALVVLAESLRPASNRCLDRRDVRCGAFHWTSQPSNGEVSIDVGQPVEGVVGQPVTITVSGSDPDADALEFSPLFGDAPGATCPAGTVLPKTDGLIWREREDGAPGEWTPPPPMPSGTLTRTFTHTYAAPGTYVACFAVNSRSSQPIEGAPDPYASHRGYTSLEVTIHETPSHTTPVDSSDSESTPSTNPT